MSAIIEVKQGVSAKAATSRKPLIDWEMMEFNRFGIIAMVIILVGCMGGITVGFNAIEVVWQMALVVFTTMAVLVTILAVTPMRWIINLSIIALLVDIVLLLMNNAF